ncbi:gamma-glutamyltransferase [Fulvivirgaceae bacterium PWU4]|uniref:Glutathione hydrolase proenzyme n=1 Tax=Chryseosolibacter histidini TaxID=2782349 RepID=A0AAP2GPV5_9BACT|nr:gamma-glutamyltransferase [Chryseosolibacter histidini]MBT1697867.1 gamma-glutamyltransferase [Chryseosolibacter histidini]
MKHRIASILLLVLLLPLVALTPTGGRIPSYAQHGMVVSASTIASEVGRDILKKGGNAIDAAVATAFALAVTWPAAGNIGGGGFIVYRDHQGKVTTFDFREKAPLAANAKMYLNEKGELIDELNHTGLLSVGVPGTVAGLYQAHAKYGKLPWAKLVQPAVELADKGIPISYALNQQAKNMRKTWEQFPSTMAVMYKGDKSYYEPGETWKQPELAKTLKRIKKNGRDGFYKGETAEKLAAFMKANNGIITTQDLEQYQAVERKPVEGTYRNVKVFTMPPPSSGGTALVEMLNILEGYDLKALGYKSADYIHVLSETMRRAFADRAEHMGDPDFNPDLPIAKLTSKEYAARLRKTITMDLASASDSSRYGQLYEGTSTTHLSVVDEQGGAVSLTYTLERSYGSQVVAEGLGFFLNDEMGDFNPVPGVTRTDGLIGSEPNQIKPGKRMLSSMTPTILEKDGKLFMVIGAPGGRTIINTVLQVILNVVDHDMNIAQAIEAPRIHHQWLPDRLNFELYGLSPDTQEKLKIKGHNINELNHNMQGNAMGIIVIPQSGLRSGAADSRSADGGVAGY